VARCNELARGSAARSDAHRSTVIARQSSLDNHRSTRSAQSSTPSARRSAPGARNSAFDAAAEGAPLTWVGAASIRLVSGTRVSGQTIRVSGCGVSAARPRCARPRCGSQLRCQRLACVRRLLPQLAVIASRHAVGIARAHQRDEVGLGRAGVLVRTILVRTRAAGRAQRDRRVGGGSVRTGRACRTGGISNQRRRARAGAQWPGIIAGTGCGENHRHACEAPDVPPPTVPKQSTARHGSGDSTTEHRPLAAEEKFRPGKAGAKLHRPAGLEPPRSSGPV
jgi:hypothetical protein